MNAKKVPGVSIVLVLQNSVNYLSYGFEEKNHRLITPYTCFELGSISKAYTALAILILERRQKLSLNDSISKYIPWLQLYDSNKKINLSNQITLGHLLHHTSGIPDNSIRIIYSNNSQKKLEDVIRKLNGITCISFPGKGMHYATINYDILGYIIEIVTAESFEVFIQENILDSLKLNNTFLSRTDVCNKNSLSSGYKLAYGHAIKYNAPEYKSNLPAGYFISNAMDMGKWILMQLGTIPLNEEVKDSIMKSHIADNSVELIGRYGYGGGWYIHCHGKIIKHGGSNPNFSNMLIIDKGKEIGICVLTNINSSAASIIAENILRLIQKKKIKPFSMDYNEKLDHIFSYISIFLIISVILFNYFIMKKVICLSYISGSLIKSLFSGVSAFSMLYLLHILFGKINRIFSRRMLTIWLPYSVTIVYWFSIILFIIIWGIATDFVL